MIFSMVYIASIIHVVYDAKKLI